MKNLLIILVWTVLFGFLSCKKSSDNTKDDTLECLSSAILYQKIDWANNSYNCNTSSGRVIKSFNVPKCEYWIVRIEAISKYDGLAIRTIQSISSTSSVKNGNGFDIKLPTGIYELFESKAAGCPYEYNGRFNISKFR